MGRLTPTNDDVAAFLAAQSRKEVYLGASGYEILERERRNCRFLTLTTAAAGLTALNVYMRHDHRAGYVLLVLLVAFAWLLMRRVRLDAYMDIYVRRGRTKEDA